MRSKLKCPFCGKELGGNMAEPCCRNQNCEMNAIPMPRTIWEKLTQAKQDLETISAKYAKFLKSRKALEQIEHKE